MKLLRKLFGKSAPPCQIHHHDQDLVIKEDIEWWSSLSIQDCQLLEQEDNHFKFAAFIKNMEMDGLSSDESARKVRLSLPYYYGKIEERDDEPFSIGAEDAKLPYVLKDRINRAVVNGMIDQKKLLQASSINALVRGLIRSGKI
jgi:hypothetical protein